MKFIIVLCIFAFHLQAFDQQPWLTTDFELYPRIAYTLQAYKNLAVNHRSVPHRSIDSFLELGVEGSALNWSADLEMTVAHTQRQNLGIDHLQITGRYCLWDDVADINPITLTPGITFTQAFTNSVRDVSSFHHGTEELEVHLSAGKELNTRHTFWLSRIWGLFGAGLALDQGSPWLHAKIAFERNWWDHHQLSFFIQSLYGLGQHRLQQRFRGYGAVKHRSVDIGFHYRYIADCLGILTVGYTYRPYAYNFPKQASIVLVRFDYPLSVVDWLPTRWLIQAKA